MGILAETISRRSSPAVEVLRMRTLGVVVFFWTGLLPCAAFQNVSAARPAGELGRVHAAALSPDQFVRRPKLTSETNEETPRSHPRLAAIGIPRPLAIRQALPVGRVSDGTIVAPVPPPGQLPAIKNTFFPATGTPDPQIAVGRHYIASIDAHDVVFYNKDTSPLAPVLGGVAPSLTSYELFQRFLAPQLKNGKPNPENVNLFAGFPAKPVSSPSYPASPPLGCDLTKDSTGLPKGTTSCINEVYDLRVAYDAQRDRFILAGTARNQTWVYPDAVKACLSADEAKNKVDPAVHDCYSASDPRAALGRRYSMFAVSITEDPRNGFYTYWISAGGDWPMIGVNANFFSITYRTADPVPIGSIFRMDDLAKGSGSAPSWWFYAKDLGVPGPNTSAPGRVARSVSGCTSAADHARERRK